MIIFLEIIDLIDEACEEFEDYADDVVTLFAFVNYLKQKIESKYLDDRK